MKTGLLGRHIAHSRSPEIHTRYYRKHHLPFEYALFDIPRERIQHFIDVLDENQIVGFNVTIPYKQDIIGYVHELHASALECDAINTVVVKDGWRIGYNTDVYGFKKSLEDNRIQVKGKRVLILGSGGAARAVYVGLRNLDARVDMAFHSQERRKYFQDVEQIIPLEEVHDIGGYSLVVNCTKLGSIEDDRMPVEIQNFHKDTVLYDLNYVPMHSAFLRWGTQRGLQVVNGECMLYNQAIRSIELWKEALRIF